MRFTLLAAAICLASASAHAEDVKLRKDPALPDLFKAMQTSHIARPIAALIRSEDVPHWVKGIGKNRNYVTGPTLAVDSPLPGALVFKACETAACAERIEIVVGPHENHAYGLLLEGKNQRFIGHPKPKAEAILSAAMAQ